MSLYINYNYGFFLECAMNNGYLYALNEALANGATDEQIKEYKKLYFNK